MEDEKKKFLLSRIKREQTLIVTQFQKYKRVYHSREITLEKHDPFLEQISHIIQINNSLASSLYEYLDRTQMEAVFTRINAVFTDLVEKYRKCISQLTFLQSNRNVKQIREICDVCHEKMETCRIQNIRKGLDEESECRAAVIKKLIEDSEIQRTTPVFTEQQDKQFKRELEKVFKNKELVLQTNIHESNVFLATVEEEMAEFMVTFRKDFAEWGGRQIEQQNQNWGKIMKSYINKKLTNSFNNKIPNWIKKMHELFVDSQPTKPKQYFMNKECQVGIPTESQEKLIQQLQELNHSLIMKREALKDKERQLEHEKIRSKALKTELESIQQYYVDKLYANGKDEGVKEKMAQLEEIIARDSSKNSSNNLRDSYGREKGQLNQIEVDPRETRSKKKLARINYQVMIQKSPKELKDLKQQFERRQRNSTQNTSLLHNRSALPAELKSQKSANNLQMRKQSSLKQSSPLLSSFEGSSSYIEQGNLKLKRKAYNRQKRESLMSDYEKDKNSQSVCLDQKENEKSELKNEVKNICSQLSKELKFKKVSKGKSVRGFNSISITEDATLPQIHEEPKSPSAYLLPSAETSGSKHKQVISSDVKTRATHINQTLAKEISGLKLDQVIDSLVQLSKCEEIVTIDDKARLNKIIQKFFRNLEWKNSKSLLYSPFKMSKVILSGAKQDLPQSPIKNQQFKSLKKQHKRQYESLERKNKSLHTHIFKLPAISVKNYNFRESEASNNKELFSLFIDEASAQQFQESFEASKEKHSTKPTPAQLQEIQKMFSELQLLKRRNNFGYLRFCSYLRFPFSSTRQNSSQMNPVSGFSFPTFCNYFMKILWLHRDCPIEEGHKFCFHVAKLEKKMLSYFPDIKPNKIRRTDRLQIVNGIN